MKELVRWYSSADALHPIVRSARLHSEFVRIHLFVDGNGRTGRLLMNLDLMRMGYPPAVISREERLSYYEALDTAHTTGNLSLFEQLVERRVETSLDLYLEVLEGKR